MICFTFILTCEFHFFYFIALIKLHTTLIDPRFPIKLSIQWFFKIKLNLPTQTIRPPKRKDIVSTKHSKIRTARFLELFLPFHSILLRLLFGVKKSRKFELSIKTNFNAAVTDRQNNMCASDHEFNHVFIRSRMSLWCHK